MELLDITLEDLEREVKDNNKKLVIYGLGVVGKSVLPYFMESLDVANEVLFIVDRDTKKQGQFWEIGGRDIEIRPPEAICKVTEDFIVMITGSRYSSILDCLEEFKKKKDFETVLFPEMLRKRSTKLPNYRIDNTKIPKVIHYCWFGDGRMPEDQQEYIHSWEKYCPGYEIRCWTEKDFDLNKYPYTRQAYEKKKWSYVSDVVRLEVLYEHGGIYLDTDVEVIRPLDDLLYQTGFVGIEKWGVINTGGGCGVVPKNELIKRILDEKLKEGFILHDGSINTESSGYYETKVFVDAGFKPNNTIQTIEGITVYTSDFFHPYDYMSKDLKITENTYSIHHFAGSWL